MTKYAKGGLIEPADKAMHFQLSPGAYYCPAELVRTYGADLLGQLNAMHLKEPNDD